MAQNNLNKLLLGLFKKVDQAFQQIAQRFPESVKCQKGCSDCCHAAFDVSLIEAHLIKERFSALGKKNKKYILKRAKAADQQWKIYNFEHHSDLSKIRIPCPLLDRNEHCLLYEARPVNCRSYGVPIQIQHSARVCPHSAFKEGVTYPTIKLHLIQAELLELSRQLSKTQYYKRFTIAQAVLLPSLV